MPKLGMEPIRREQICRAAAKVISEQGFAGTTMRMVAEEAGCSTGMLNHYFANRMEMLEHTLVFVSERQQARELAAIENLEPGKERLRAWVRVILPTTQETSEAWQIWIAAYGASRRFEQLARVMTVRNKLALKIAERALEGIVTPKRGQKVPYAWQLDSMMTGLVMRALTTDAGFSLASIERVLVESALEYGHVVSDGQANRQEVALSLRQ